MFLLKVFVLLGFMMRFKAPNLNYDEIFKPKLDNKRNRTPDLDKN